MIDKGFFRLIQRRPEQDRIQEIEKDIFYNVEFDPGSG